jgi:hypothetical protein
MGTGGGSSDDGASLKNIRLRLPPEHTDVVVDLGSPNTATATTTVSGEGPSPSLRRLGFASAPPSLQAQQLRGTARASGNLGRHPNPFQNSSTGHADNDDSSSSGSSLDSSDDSENEHRSTSLLRSRGPRHLDRLKNELASRYAQTSGLDETQAKEVIRDTFFNANEPWYFVDGVTAALFCHYERTTRGSIEDGDVGDGGVLQ